MSVPFDLQMPLKSEEFIFSLNITEPCVPDSFYGSQVETKVIQVGEND